MSRIFQITTIKEVWILLLPRERKSAAKLLVLMVVGTLFEIISVSALVPVVTALTNPEAMMQYPGGGWLNDILQQYGKATAVTTALCGMLFLYLVKTAFLGFLSWRQANFTYGVLASISRRLYEKYLNMPYEYQRPDLVVVDRGYRGHGVQATRVLISGTRRGLTPKLIADLRRRSAIEAEIGHMKTDGRLYPMPPERHHRRRSLRRPERLWPQHPQDPDPHPGLACLDYSIAVIRCCGPRATGSNWSASDWKIS